jgi:zinc/manganese transport system substrate-binding protein
MPDYRRRPLVLGARAMALVVAAILLAACGSPSPSAESDGRPTIVVTTSVMGDIVENLVGDGAAVEVVMPAGVDPHEFQLSAQQANTIRQADALVINGAGFEGSLVDSIDSAASDGVPVCVAIDGVDAVLIANGDHDHGDGDVDDDHGHDDEGTDPHFFTDPARTADAAEGLVDCLAAAVPSLQGQEFDAAAGSYVDQLRALDAELSAALETIPEDDRLLVTNHDVFGYFADRYGFEVIGVIIPGASTQVGVDARSLDTLASAMAEAEVSAVFADTSSPDDLAATLAAEVGDVEVVVLFSESLGGEDSGGATYIEMMRTNAERMVAALAGN